MRARLTRVRAAPGYPRRLIGAGRGWSWPACTGTPGWRSRMVVAVIFYLMGSAPQCAQRGSAAPRRVLAGKVWVRHICRPRRGYAIVTVQVPAHRRRLRVDAEYEFPPAPSSRLPPREVSALLSALATDRGQLPPPRTPIGRLKLLDVVENSKPRCWSFPAGGARVLIGFDADRLLHSVAGTGGDTPPLPLLHRRHTQYTIHDRSLHHNTMTRLSWWLPRDVGSVEATRPAGGVPMR